MSYKITQIGKVALEYLAQYKDSSKRTIATLMALEHPELYSSVEHARGVIRKYTNASGTSKVKNPVDHNTQYSRENPFGIPESTGKIRQYFKVKGKKVLWLSDIHFPNHDIGALNAALQFGKDDKIDTIIIGGDLLDNEPFTNHLNPPPILTDVKRWFDMIIEFLDMLKIQFPKAEIHFMEGNHDAWYKRWLMSKAQLLFHDEYYTLSSRLKLREKGIQWHGESIIVQAGKLPMTHGHLIVKGFFSPVNPARGVFNKLKSSMLIGHCHQTSEHSESNLSGEVITTYSTGCLCTLAPDYDPFNTRHNLGFARIDVDSSDNYKVFNKRIDLHTKDIY